MESGKWDAKQIEIDVTPYKGEWLALHPDTHEVIAHDVSVKVAYQAAVKQGIKPLMYPVPKSDAYFVGVS